MHTKLEVDVRGHWNNKPPIYRIYINNEMLIERTFGWPLDQAYIIEHMYCDLDTGVHTLYLENLDPTSRFELDHFYVDKVLVNKNLLKASGTHVEWKFIVDHLLNHQALHLQESNDSTVTAHRPAAIEIAMPERPKKTVQVKKYETYAPLVQRMRQLNTRK